METKLMTDSWQILYENLCSWYALAAKFIGSLLYVYILDFEKTGCFSKILNFSIIAKKLLTDM